MIMKKSIMGLIRFGCSCSFTLKYVGGGGPFQKNILSFTYKSAKKLIIMNYRFVNICPIVIYCHIQDFINVTIKITTHFGFNF